MNVIVAVIDTLRYDHVGPDGTDAVDTPNIDRFAERSIWFSRAFASSFPTIPVRQDMLLGRGGKPFHGWSPLDCTKPSLPGVMADAGYVTQLIHDTPHLVNGGHRFDYPFHAWTPIRGAECDRPWIANEPPFLDNWAFDDRFDGYGIERDREATFEGSKDTLRNYAYAHRNRTEHEDWNVAQLFETASAFLRDNDERENFFLWLDCFDPHEPWDAPPEYMAKYDSGPHADGTIDPRGFHDDVYNDPDLAPEAREHKVAQYRAKLDFMDDWFGQFTETLAETGLIENTAVLVFGDHGTNLDDAPDDRRNFGKDSPPARNEAHVPMMLHVPGEGAGRCETPVRLLDVFATVAERAGAEIPDGVTSTDMLTVARDPAARPHEVVPVGKQVSDWAEKGPTDVLCYAYDEEWALGLAADPESCVLRPIDGREEVSADNPDVVGRLREAAIDELAALDLDESLVEWLRAGGDTAMPETYDGRDGDGPEWFSAYFQRPIPE